MSSRHSFSARLREELAEIEEAFQDVLRRSTIDNVDLNRGASSFVFIGFASHAWRADDSLIGQRTRLLQRLEEWTELFNLLHRSAVPSTRKRIDEQVDLLRGWLARDGGDHSIPARIDQAEKKAAAAFDELRQLIHIGEHGPATLLVVPDTNALIRQPSVATYSGLFERGDLTVVMLPTVMAELDELKDRGRTPDVRDAAAAVVRRLKGFRDRGDIRNGVPVEGKVSLRMVHREPRVGDILDWLDPTVPDDRLLAAALDLQARHPKATVVLVTADINLQNKAAVVGLPFSDPPDV